MSTVKGIRIDADLQQRLQKVAAGMERTEQWVIRTALVEYLDVAEEELLELAIMNERWQEYLNTGESIPNDEVMAWLKKKMKGEVVALPTSSGSTNP